MEKCCIVIFVALCLAAATIAFPTIDDLHVGEPVFYPKEQNGRIFYAGVYKDVCYFDGVYYGSESELVFCSNGDTTIQYCPYGSRNSDIKNYIYGNYYGYDDFCNVNLVNAEFVDNYINRA